MQLPRTRGFSDAVERASHYSDHGGDFAAINEAVYEAMADRFMGKAMTVQMHECPRRSGDRVRFDRVTNEFGVVSSAGIIRTYYVPKPCASLPLGVRKIRCHKFPSNMQYVIDTCSKY